jgi:hypothetical protein
MRTGDLSELSRNDERVEPVRSGRLHQHGDEADQPRVHRPGGGAADQPLPAAERSRGGARSFGRRAPTTSRTASCRTTSTSSTSASTASPARATTTRSSCRYSYQNDRVEPPVLDDPIASGDFNSSIFITGQNAVGGWSRDLRLERVQRVPRGYNRVQLDALHPAFGIDSNKEYGIKGVPSDRFYGGLPHMNDRPLHAPRRAVLPAAVPDLAGLPVLREPHLAKGSHSMKFGAERRRDLVRYIDLRSLNGELTFSDGRYTGYRPSATSCSAWLRARSASRLFHEPDSVCRRLADLRPGQLAPDAQDHGELRHPLRALHAALRRGATSSRTSTPPPAR